MDSAKRMDEHCGRAELANAELIMAEILRGFDQPCDSRDLRKLRMQSRPGKSIGFSDFPVFERRLPLLRIALQPFGLLSEGEAVPPLDRLLECLDDHAQHAGIPLFEIGERVLPRRISSDYVLRGKAAHYWHIRGGSAASGEAEGMDV